MCFLLLHVTFSISFCLVVLYNLIINLILQNISSQKLSTQPVLYKTFLKILNVPITKYGLLEDINDLNIHFYMHTRILILALHIFNCKIVFFFLVFLQFDISITLNHFFIINKLAVIFVIPHPFNGIVCACAYQICVCHDWFILFNIS